ncbi:MAG: 4-aminobutyrate--2-oxoglutarate transaminase [Deltaproteobacteria bacterium]|nr:4-aminobutyrate--2-oxoglutarate transaminase [Deltaproteobacteria bacterium]
MKVLSNSQLGELRSQYFSSGLGCVSTKFIESGQGAILRDVEGREYIDFAGGIGAMSVGHSHPKIVAAIKSQAEKMTHCCIMINQYPPAIALAEKLCQITPGEFLKKVVLFSSGAEAVENAVKIARYYTKRPAIIVFENGYHGRTLLTMSMTSKMKPYKFGFGPFAPEIYRMPFGDVAGPEKLHDFFVKYVNPEAVAAVVAEPVQGEGGFIAPPPDYFQELVKICHDNGILFVADEIQSGLGRTGKMFAIEHWGVEPDIMTVGKSLAAGMPLSAVVGKAKIMDCVHPWGLGGTYGGNPVACAAALAFMEVFESEKMLDKSIALGKKLRDRFEKWQKKFDLAGEIRGLGAMLGLALVKGPKGEPAAEEAGQLVNYCHENGLIILSCGTFGNIIRTLIPFVITDDQLEKGLAIMEDGLTSICK